MPRNSRWISQDLVHPQTRADRHDHEPMDRMREDKQLALTIEGVAGDSRSKALIGVVSRGLPLQFMLENDQSYHSFDF